VPLTDTSGTLYRVRLAGMMQGPFRPPGAHFLPEAALNENASLIIGSVCGVFVENVDDPLMQEIRSLDKILRAAPASS